MISKTIIEYFLEQGDIASCLQLTPDSIPYKKFYSLFQEIRRVIDCAERDELKKLAQNLLVAFCKKFPAWDTKRKHDKKTQAIFKIVGSFPNNPNAIYFGERPDFPDDYNYENEIEKYYQRWQIALEGLLEIGELNFRYWYGDEQDSTGLMNAVKYGDYRLTKMFIDAGADINSDDILMLAVTHQVSNENQHMIVRMLLDSKAIINRNGDNGHTLLKMAIDSYSNSYQCNEKIIEFLLDAGARNEDLRLFNLACQKRLSLQVFQLLCERLLTTQEKKNNVLFLILQPEYKHYVKKILDLGADPNAVNADGDTPLYYLAKNGNNREIVETLLEAGAKIDIKNADGNDYPHLAAIVRDYFSDQTNVYFQDLLDKYPDCAKVTNYRGETLLHVLLRNQKPYPLHKFLNDCQTFISAGVDINAQDSEGMTALMLMAQIGAPNVVEFLLDNNALVDLVNNNGDNALILVSKKYNARNKEEIPKDNYEQTMAWHAVTKLLINANAKLDIVNRDGLNALQIAAERNYLDLVKLLYQGKTLLF
ncbi:MAG: ankyrin repeat domain-containing protein [Deltaproteobacteria bacterium]|jgi:ankyrin repeat protein|nr:ankyrin repeat domain-containing protein [Deltaproteobacteria bacterium]